MRRVLISIVFASFLASPGQTFGQSLTGSLVGIVHDAQSGSVRGASMSIRGPALIGGVRTVATNGQGHARVTTLPPGVYSLEVSAPGFAPYREAGIRIGVGATIER